MADQHEDGRTSLAIGLLVACVLVLAVWFGQGEQPKRLDAPRSGHWPVVRAEHLAKEPGCAVCGKKGSSNEVHHERPFHEHPELELDAANLITLCRDHHFLFGHLLSWQSHNPDVRKDAAVWREKIKNRPTSARATR